MNRYARATAAVTALLLLAGAALALTSGAAQAAGKTCITQHESGFWARVVIPNDGICTGVNDSGSDLAISLISNNRPKPAVMPVWDLRNNRPTWRFFYQDSLPDLQPAIPTAPLSFDQDGEENDNYRLQYVDFDVIYTPSEDHRAVRVLGYNGNHCYREWRGSDGSWHRSESYGYGVEPCRQAAWNTYQHSQGNTLLDYARRNWTFADYQALGWSRQDYDRLRESLGFPTTSPPDYDHASVAEAISRGRNIGGYGFTCVDDARNLSGGCVRGHQIDYSNPVSGVHITTEPPKIVQPGSTNQDGTRNSPVIGHTTTLCVVGHPRCPTP